MQRFELRAGPRRNWTIERLARLLYGDAADQDGLASVAGLPELAQGWRHLARRRLVSGEIEDWTKRLYGEQPSH